MPTEPQPTARHDETRSDSGEKRVAGSRERPVVLIVDDEALVRNVTRRLLEADSWDVFTAGSGSEALSLVARIPRPVDLVLVDDNMPEMSGVETAREIARVAPGVPVIMITGGADIGRLRECGFRVLGKPYSGELLLDACRRAVSRHG